MAIDSSIGIMAGCGVSAQPKFTKAAGDRAFLSRRIDRTERLRRVCVIDCDGLSSQILLVARLVKGNRMQLVQSLKSSEECNRIVKAIDVYRKLAFSSDDYQRSIRPGPQLEWTIEGWVRHQ